MPHFYSTCIGPIKDLYLPPVAWDVLRREKIRTLEQLRSVADGIDRLPGIGDGSARVVREELARLTSLEEQPSDKGQPLSPWSA
jgi:hypothetical protein